MSHEPKDRPADIRPSWQAPRLRRIGTIRDIAQRESPLSQANQDKRS